MPDTPTGVITLRGSLGPPWHDSPTGIITLGGTVTEQIAPTVPGRYVPQQTLQYSTFIKRALVEALRDAFAGHPTKPVANARVALDFGHDRWKLPGIIIKFFERDLSNAGVGHVEWLPNPITADPTNPYTVFTKYYHRLYHGDISFDIYGASAVDRDVVRDALIETLAMTSAWEAVTPAGQSFLDRFYNYGANTPYGTWHFPTLMLDQITGYGEQHQIAPWAPEDTLVYQVSYRVPIVGEFYSNTPAMPGGSGLLQEVDVYPYIAGTDPSPADNPDAPTVYNPAYPPTDPRSYTTSDWYRFTG